MQEYYLRNEGKMALKPGIVFGQHEGYNKR